MEKVSLKVITVPAQNPVSYQEHTAFSVSAQMAEGKLLFACGWTLRDAIEFFCRWFHVNRNQIVLQRPFLPQRIMDDDNK